MVAEFLERAAPRVPGLEVAGLLARTGSLDRARGLAARTDVPLVTTEFRAFVRAVAEDDRAAASAWLDRSIAVSRVQTAARLAAGIRFPKDG